MRRKCLDVDQPLPHNGLGERRPLLVASGVQGSLCQLEVRAVRVVHDEQPVPCGFDVVLNPVTSGRHDSRDAQRRRRVEQQHLGGQLGPHLDDDPGIVSRRPDAHPEPLVRLVEHQNVVKGSRANLVTPHLVRAPRLVQPRVEEMLPVERPDGAVAGLRDGLIDHLAGLDVFDPQGKSLVALDIDGVGDPAPVTTHLEGSEREELVSLGLDVAVQQHLLTLRGDSRLELWTPAALHHANAALCGVLLVIESAGVVPPAAVGRRDRQVCLLRP